MFPKTYGVYVSFPCPPPKTLVIIPLLIVMLANASNAIIVGFDVRPDPVAAENAERNGVDLRLYRIIYDWGI